MSAARDIKGPWLNTEVLSRVPKAHREFDLNRDPYIARQILDLQKTEKQRREESEGRGSNMVKRERPALKPAPGNDLRKSVDRAAFGDRWLAERRDAVLAQAAAKDARKEAARENTLDHGRAAHPEMPRLSRGPSL